LVLKQAGGAATKGMIHRPPPLWSSKVEAVIEELSERRQAC